MGFGITGLNILKEIIDDKETVNHYKMHPEDFTRNRKIGATDLIYYCLNRKGLCTAIETNNFFVKTGRNESITAQSLFTKESLS